MSLSKQFTVSRRKFFATSGAAALSIGVGSSTHAAEPNLQKSDMNYELSRSEKEWRAMLSDYEYDILRVGRTEAPKTSPLWEETAEGTYHCKGCELQIYDGRWKTVLNKGWVFFFHSEPNAVLTGIDGPVAEYGQSSAGYAANMEIHCRRCGSHLGHLLVIEDLMRHCINGTALHFQPTAA